MIEPSPLPLDFGFWRESLPLILASRSQGRRLALEQTAIPFSAEPVEVDERETERRIRAQGGDADDVASGLARAKALALSVQKRDRLVLGADQVVSCEGRLFGKPVDMTAAREQLEFMSGRTHRLHSAIALARGGKIVAEAIGHADMEMRAFSAEFLDVYLAKIGDAVLTSAGGYQVEGLGVHLFASIRGDHWTIVGLPLLPLLEALRRLGAVLA